MNTATATDAVTDDIASIEMHRQELERDAGLEASRNFALRRLQEILHREQEALQLHGPGGGHPANIEAVRIAINKVKALGGSGSRRPGPRMLQARPPRKSLRGGSQRPPSTRVRRTMGRGSGR